jgi:hypothetical protein
MADLADFIDAPEVLSYHFPFRFPGKAANVTVRDGYLTALAKLMSS